MTMMPMSSPVRSLLVTTAAAVGLAIVPPSFLAFLAPVEAFYVRCGGCDRCLGRHMSTATLERASDADFVLVTEWHLAAGIDAVWQALNHPDYWPRWWPYVRAVEKLRGGGAEGVGSLYRIEWTSKLPYDLTFE